MTRTVGIRTQIKKLQERMDICAWKIEEANALERSQRSDLDKMQRDLEALRKVRRTRREQ